MPVTKLSLREMKSNNKPWITKGVLKSINQKDAIYKKFVRAKNPHSKEIYHLAFKRYKSMINRLLELTNQNITKHLLVNTKQILSKPGKLCGL